MHSSSEQQEFQRILNAITDEKLRYFYLRLGAAIADTLAHGAIPVSEIATIAQRLDRAG